MVPSVPSYGSVGDGRCIGCCVCWNKESAGKQFLVCRESVKMEWLRLFVAGGLEMLV